MLQEIKWYIEDHKKLVMGVISAVIIFILVGIGLMMRSGSVDEEAYTGLSDEAIQQELVVSDKGVANNTISEFNPSHPELLPTDGTGGDYGFGRLKDSQGKPFNGLYIKGISSMDLDLDYLTLLGIEVYSFPNKEMRADNTGVDSDSVAIYVDGLDYYEFDFSTMEELANTLDDIKNSK